MGEEEETADGVGASVSAFARAVDLSVVLVDCGVIGRPVDGG